MRPKTWPIALLLLSAPTFAHAAFLDCLFFDGLDGDTTSAPTAWRGNLGLHNCARKTVMPSASPSIPMLRWSAPIAQTAQNHANQCVYRHSGTPGLGENIYASSGFADPASHAATLWAAEYADYDYASNSCAAGRVCGHYTQMVWRSSTQLGCGIRNCSTGSPFPGFPNWTLVVCNYSPPGNYGGRPY